MYINQCYVVLITISYKRIKINLMNSKIICGDVDFANLLNLRKFNMGKTRFPDLVT